ncbi:MAG: MFS transporter [Sphaerochaetaceae bacterium]
MEKKTKSFNFYSVAFCILGVVFMFMYSGLQNDQINIIQAFSAWSNGATQLPMTVGNLVCILLTLVYGTCFIKYGVKKTLIPCILISAVGCVGIALANGLKVNGGVGLYWLYFVSMFIVRCACMCLQMAGFMLCSNWFIKYRGRVMGIITLGSPLFSVVGTSVMSNFIANHMGNDYRIFYFGIAIVLGLMAIATVFLIEDNPEDVGLHPDGSINAPLSEKGSETNLTIKQVLSQKKAWLLIVSFGAFQFIISACMGSMAVRFMALGGIPVWLSATKWLAFGALLGIPMSFIFGVFDDKFGSIKASFILGLTELIPILALWFMPQGGDTSLEILWGFGVACMTGGVPTMHPSITAYCYGRKEYQSANRIIMSIQLIPSAIAAMMMVSLIDAGKSNIAFAILLGITIIGLVATFMMRGMKDANEADRAYAGNAK